MLISLISIAMVLLIGYLWLTRFFSALIHSVRVIIAGPWRCGGEPIATYLLGVGSPTGIVAARRGRGAGVAVR